ncbi:MAG: TldD/PmbA family protein [Anaerolineales bacterium]|jgi:predicted Zn-dependent protease
MITKQEAQDLTHKVLQRCGSDPAEVVLVARDDVLTRFANNTIHQNVAELDLNLVLKVFVDGSVGTATTNRMGPDDWDALIARARQNAAASPEEPDHPGLADPAEFPDLQAYDQAAAEFAPKARAEQVGGVCRAAEQQGLNASGAFSTGVRFVAVANSRGLFAYHRGTHADFQTVVMAEDASGRAQASGWRLHDVPVENVGREALRKAANGRDPQNIEPGAYTVVVDPYVTQDLLYMLDLYGMGALSVLEGRSWMNERIGERAMSPLISIWDDGLDLNGLPQPFDYEGTPRQRVDIVTQGVVQAPVHDRRTAQKMGQASTGHAISSLVPTFMRTFGPLAFNLFMAPGEASLEEMIASTERGLYITRFWYTRLVHPSDCVVTGMTRDGVFLITDGEISHPVKNLRFTQSYVEALNNVEAVGNETLLLAEGDGRMLFRVPALKIRAFNFTGSTL